MSDAGLDRAAIRSAVLLGALFLGTMAWAWLRAPAAQRKHIEVVLASEAGDDGVATLSMILRAHGVAASFDEVRKALYAGSDVDKPNALMMLRAAEHFGLKVRGVQVTGAHDLHLLRGPCIAHVTMTRGTFPRPLDSLKHDDGKFVVIEYVEGETVSIIDPYGGGRHLRSLQEFMETASGVVLLFDGE